MRRCDLGSSSLATTPQTSSSSASDARRVPRWYSRFLGVAVLALMVATLGFVGQVTPLLRILSAVLVFLFALEHLLNWRLAVSFRDYMRRWGVHAGMAVVALLVMTGLQIMIPWDGSVNGKMVLLAHGLVQGGMLVSLALRALRHQAQLTKLHIRPGWLFMGSFVMLILLGTLLLKLPRAVVAGETLGWLDALFTSTSAVCVTGLSVENTAKFFTPMGQVIILALIQLGGLGIMTLTFYLSAILFRGMSLYDRQALGEMISEKHLTQVADSVRFIILFTLATEAAGALLFFSFLPEDRGLAERVFQSVFHSISAFCNAGFSTLPDGLADRWVRNNAGVQLVISALIVFGGIGAVVLRDLISALRQRLRRLRDPAQIRPRLRVHTRLVLWVNALLIFGGGAAIWVSEFWLHPGEANGGSGLTALFHSVTARTAGFNTVDMGGIGPVTIHLVVLLMVIGGSPGGTAGGVRTTVFATAALHLWNLIRMTPDLVMFRRNLPAEVGPRALAILVLTMGWLFVNFAFLRQCQPDVTDTRLVFELVSAFATVGLSLNLTADLTDAAKWVIILNMFVGRIGLITVVSTLAPVARKRPVQRPTEDIILA